MERELDAARRAESEMAWKEFVELFLGKHAASKPATTLCVYRQCLNAFTEAVKPRKLARVTHAVLEDGKAKGNSEGSDEKM